MGRNLVFAVLLLLFLFGGATQSPAQDPQADSSETSFTSNQSDNEPFELPFGTEPALPGGSEPPDENEPEEEEELDSDEDDTEHRYRAIEASVSHDCSETLRLNYQRLFQHQASVSLVILHHSWKSHLS
jgi:hypothetical protein